jgi:uncharacterized OB-fold protein
MATTAIEPGLIAFSDDGDACGLIGNRCDRCATTFHPPRPVCLACHGRALTDVMLPGTGVLHACTHVQMPLRPGRRKSREYWVAQVDLDGGPRVQGLLAPEIGEPRIGMQHAIALETLREDENGDRIVVHHFRAVEGAR